MTAQIPSNRQIVDIAQSMIKEEGSFVFLIGAGGSASVGVPTADSMRKYLMEFWHDPLQHEIDKERDEYNIPSLENLPLQLMLYFFQKIPGNIMSSENFLKGQLDYFTNDNVFSPVAYELLAHMSKHGLVDYIISTNFDELLDESMDEEHGRGNYTYIPSLSAFASVRDQIEGISRGRRPDLPTPYLLKPHGTLSLSPTLRFAAGDHLLAFEEHKRIVLEHVLTDRNLIIAGYGCWDPNFYHLLMSLISANKLRNIYIVDNNPDAVGNKENKLHKLLRAIDVRNVSKTYIGDLSHGFINSSFDDFMISLDKEIINFTNTEGYYPISSRHVIRSHIFGNRNLNFDITLKNKLLLELIIFSLKMRGKFSTKHLLYNDGVEYYLSKIIGNHNDGGDDSISAREILNILEMNDILEFKSVNLESLEMEDEHQKFEEYQTLEQLCFLKLPIKKEYDEYDIKNVIEDVIDTIIDKLYSLFDKETNEDIESHIIENSKTILRESMINLVEKFDYDLEISVHPYDFSFLSPKHITKETDYRESRASLQILEKSVKEDLDCFVISETGKWLADQIGHFRSRNKDRWMSIKEHIDKNKVHVIISNPKDDLDNSFPRFMSEYYSKKLVEIFGRQNIKLLDWRLNRHLGVFSETQCLYVYREGKAPTLQPLELVHEKDKKMMMTVAKNHWEKAIYL